LAHFLLEKICSFSRSTCLASRGDEITMVVMLPSFSVMIGPLTLESFDSDLCGFLQVVRCFQLLKVGVVVMEAW